MRPSLAAPSVIRSQHRLKVVWGCRKGARENVYQIKAVNFGFSMHLGVRSVPLDLCRSWGHMSAPSDRNGTELLTVPCRVSWGHLCWRLSLQLVGIHGLEGGMRKNCISWISMCAISGGEAHQVVPQWSDCRVCKQHRFLPGCEGNFQLIFQFSRPVAGKESKVAPCFLHSAPLYYLEKHWARQSLPCFILLWVCHVSLSCLVSLVGWAHVNYYRTLELLRKNAFPKCSNRHGLFLHVRLVCFGNGWKSSFKNCLVKTQHMVHVNSWLCQWFAKGRVADEQEVLPWHMGLLTVSWNVNWWYLLNRDCLFLIICSSTWFPSPAPLPDLRTVNPLIRAQSLLS